MTKRVRELFRLSNDFLGDLLTGTQVFYTFQLPPFASLRTDPSTAAGIDRICVFHLVLTLSKWAELYDRYQAVIPPAVRPEAKDLRKAIDARGVRGLRNRYVGHVWDKKLKRPLTEPEFTLDLERVVGPGILAFMRWINDPEVTDHSGTVVGIVEHVRDALRSANGFTDADLLT